MSEALWHDLDTWLVTRIDDALGSGHASLNAARVETALTMDVREWETWSKPAVVVIGYDCLRTPGPHGDGAAHVEKRYRYALLVLTEGVQSEAKRDAKFVLARLEAALLDALADLDLAPSSDGETIVLLEIGNSSLTAERKGNGWMVIAGMGLDVVSEV